MIWLPVSNFEKLVDFEAATWTILWNRKSLRKTKRLTSFAVFKFTIAKFLCLQMKDVIARFEVTIADLNEALRLANEEKIEKEKENE